MMWPPIYALPLVVFLVMSVLGLWLRPPLTPRGRTFYALNSLSGIVTGAAWLLWNAALCGFERPRTPWEPATPVSEIVGDMFSVAKDGLAPSSILACIICAAGLWVGRHAFMGPSHQDSHVHSRSGEK